MHLVSFPVKKKFNHMYLSKLLSELCKDTTLKLKMLRCFIIKLETY